MHIDHIKIKQWFFIAVEDKHNFWSEPQHPMMRYHHSDSSVAKFNDGSYRVHTHQLNELLYQFGLKIYVTPVIQFPNRIVR